MVAAGCSPHAALLLWLLEPSSLISKGAGLASPASRSCDRAFWATAVRNSEEFAQVVLLMGWEEVSCPPLWEPNRSCMAAKSEAESVAPALASAQLQPWECVPREPQLHAWHHVPLGAIRVVFYHMEQGLMLFRMLFGCAVLGAPGSMGSCDHLHSAGNSSVCVCGVEEVCTYLYSLMQE